VVHTLRIGKTGQTCTQVNMLAAFPQTTAIDRCVEPL